MTKNSYIKLRQNLNFEFSYHNLSQQLITDLFFVISIVGLFKTPLAALNIFLIPLFMFRQFAILHEAVHGLASPHTTYNFILGMISGTLCLTPYSVWKTAHMKHHYWTGNLEQDPTFSLLKNYKHSSKSKKQLIEYSWRLGIPYLSTLQHLAFWLYGLKNAKSVKAFLELTLPFAFYTIALYNLNFGSLLILSIGILIYLRIYEDMIVPQHVGLCSDEDHDSHPAIWDQPHVTRTWAMHPAVEKYVVLNMNYHTEHHLFPDLPWHQLKRAHQMIQETNSGDLNIIFFYQWIKQQRSRRFSDVIAPISKKKNLAA